MSRENECQSCHKPLSSSGFAGGICPACLLKPGLSSASEIYSTWLNTTEDTETGSFLELAKDDPNLESDLIQLDSIFQLGRAAATSRSLHQSIRERIGDLDEIHLTLEEPPASNAASEEEFRNGAKKYQRIEEIARGGMGVIYLVEDQDLNRKLAMKVLEEKNKKGSTVGSSSSRISRFMEEAQVTAQLDHPSIVPVHDIGFDDSGQLFFTMKLIHGREFAEVIDLVNENESGWTLSRAVGVLSQAAQAVAYAHDRKVIHRDLKPANLMVGDYGEVFVMDWGLARIRNRQDLHNVQLDRHRQESDQSHSDAMLTMEGTVVGTPAYMSPEQARGEIEAIDERSDVYSLGAILYHLISGQPPFVGKERKTTAKKILRQVLSGPPRSLMQVAPEAPGPLVAVCERAMARKPEDRYANAAEMAEELQAWMEQRVVKTYRRGPWAELIAWVRRNRATAFWIGTATSILVAALALIALIQTQANQEFRIRNYVSEINRAGDLASTGRIPETKKILENIPKEFRHWEWRFLKTTLFIGCSANTRSIQSKRNTSSSNS
jgi:serine/threonine protein kinase